jgi:hypothetical protein
MTSTAGARGSSRDIAGAGGRRRGVAHFALRHGLLVRLRIIVCRRVLVRLRIIARPQRVLRLQIVV